jgi:hypothetical protein
VCNRIGPRYAADCGCNVTSVGDQLQWVDNLRYLGIYIVSDKSFRCCFDYAVYGKIGRTASEEVTLSLIKSECLPCLLFGMEACPLNKSDFRSLIFTVERVIMKTFHTKSDLVIKECRDIFSFLSVELLVKQKKKVSAELLRIN